MPRQRERWLILHGDITVGAAKAEEARAAGGTEVVVVDDVFLAALDGSCRTPIAGHAVVDGDGLRFTGMILRPDGSEAHEVTGEGATADAEAIGRDAGARVRATAGAKFFEDWS